MRKNLIILTALISIGLILYGQSLWNPFVFDDTLQILKNDFVQKLDWAAIFAGSTFASYGKALASGIYYKPFLSALYGIFWYLGNGSSFIFHFAQLLLAIANAFLFYYLLKGWINTRLAFLISILFLVYPINSEVILYIADLQDVLYVFWGLLALILLQKKISWYFISLCLFAAILSKESGLMFLIILPIYSGLFQSDTLKKSVFTSASCLSIYFFVRFYVLGLTRLSYPIVPIASLNFFERLLNFPKSFFHYLRLFLWPNEISLHQNWIIGSIDFFNFYLPLIIGLLFLVGLVLIIIKSSAHYRKYLIFFFSILTLNTVLHSNILIPLDATVADRWFYLGSLSLLGFIAILIENLMQQSFLKKITLPLLCILIFVCGARSYYRSLEWHSGMTLFTEAYNTSPNDSAYANQLGVEYSLIDDLGKAEFYFRKSIDLQPGEGVNWNNLGTIEVRKGNFKEAEMCFLKSINNGSYPLAIENYARLLLKEERWDELNIFLEKALTELPNNQILLNIKLDLARLGHGK